MTYVLTLAAITHLNDVITCLEKNDFEEDQWKDLGLKLGIKPPKLNSIEANNPRNVKACLRECLTLWLRWNFDIEQLGKPTMESLAAAVDKMGLGDVASRILGKTNGATSQGKLDITGGLIFCIGQSKQALTQQQRVAVARAVVVV